MYDARNVGPYERWLSLGAGGLLAAAAIKRRDLAGLAAALGAAELLYRAVTGYCPVYGALGMTTSAKTGSHNPEASVPYGRGVRVEESIAVSRLASETLPLLAQTRHASAIHAARRRGYRSNRRRSRWRVRAPIGSRVTWEAEIINDVPGRLIGWRSLPGAAIHHAGSVHFDQRDGMTEVRVVLEYAPPARYVGASVARILGEEPQRQVAEDLRRFKAIVDRGEHASLQ